MKHIYEQTLIANQIIKTSCDKPNARERALEIGVESLSAHELVMLILGSGTQKKNVCELAKDAINVLNNGGGENLTERLSQIDGIGKTKALCIAAAIEIGKRFSSAVGYKVQNPSDVVPLVKHYALENREYFVAILLSGDHTVQKVNTIAIGNENRVIVKPREVLAEAVAARSSAIVICHNHPSGNINPSQSDINLTDRIYDAAEILGIRFLDHIIITENDYYSFCENNMLCGENLKRRLTIDESEIGMRPIEQSN